MRGKETKKLFFNRKENKAKKPFFEEWYIEGKPRKLWKTVNSKLALWSMIIFFIIAYGFAIVRYGNVVPQGYSDTSYNLITYQLSNYLGAQTGIDAIALRKSVKFTLVEEENPNYLGEKNAEPITIEEKVKFTLIDEDDIKIIGSIGSGEFRPEITASLSDDYAIENMVRNYDNKDVYKTAYWTAFSFFIPQALITWFFVMAGLHYSLNFVAKVSKSKYEKKQLKEETQKEDEVLKAARNREFSDDGDGLSAYDDIEN